MTQLRIMLEELRIMLEELRNKDLELLKNEIEVILFEREQERIALEREEKELEMKKIENKKLKGSAKLEFSKFEKEEMFGETSRSIDANIIVTSDTEEEAEEILNLIADELEVELCDCKMTEETKNHKIKLYDIFTVDYEHGFMAQTKKNLMQDFKSIKKDLGIR